jgi:2-iminoacetate synthase ThiH
MISHFSGLSLLSKHRTLEQLDVAMAQQAAARGVASTAAMTLFLVSTRPDAVGVVQTSSWHNATKASRISTSSSRFWNGNRQIAHGNQSGESQPGRPLNCVRASRRGIGETGQRRKSMSLYQHSKPRFTRPCRDSQPGRQPACAVYNISSSHVNDVLDV